LSFSILPNIFRILAILFQKLAKTGGLEWLSHYNCIWRVSISIPIPLPLIPLTEISCSSLIGMEVLHEDLDGQEQADVDGSGPHQL